MGNGFPQLFLPNVEINQQVDGLNHPVGVLNTQGANAPYNFFTPNLLGVPSLGNVIVISGDPLNNPEQPHAPGGVIELSYDPTVTVHSVALFNVESGGEIRLLNSNNEVLFQFQVPALPMFQQLFNIGKRIKQKKTIQHFRD